MAAEGNLKILLVTLIAVHILLLSAWLQGAQAPLQIYFVDVEGGQATLFVTPAGQSLLVDTGWPENDHRDADRIAAAAKIADISKINYVLITHYHDDHVGGAPQLMDRIPAGAFIDHGPNRETGVKPDMLYVNYQKASAGSSHLSVMAGDRLPLKGIDARVVSADGNVMEQSLSGAGQPNGACSEAEQKRIDPSENARSLGVVLTFGKLKIVDLGDLTWNKELELVCPNNKIGKIDLYVVSHHGLAASNSPAFVHGIQPRVAIMNNASTKGGAPAAWDVIKSSPGLEDMWQLHFSVAGGKEHNVVDSFIANVGEADTGYYLRVNAYEDGSFEVYNPRNSFSKKYPAK